LSALAGRDTLAEAQQPPNPSGPALRPHRATLQGVSVALDESCPVTGRRILTQPRDRWLPANRRIRPHRATLQGVSAALDES
jgi:hypothetical protein